MNEKNDDNWLKDQISSAVEDQKTINKKTAKNVKRRKRVTSLSKSLVLLFFVMLVAEHFYRDDVKKWMNKHDIPLYSKVESISNGSWFKDSKARGKVMSEKGQITYTKGVLNKRTEKANEVINE